MLLGFPFVVCAVGVTLENISAQTSGEKPRTRNFSKAGTIRQNKEDSKVQAAPEDAASPSAVTG